MPQTAPSILIRTLVPPCIRRPRHLSVPCAWFNDSCCRIIHEISQQISHDYPYKTVQFPIKNPINPSKIHLKVPFQVPMKHIKISKSPTLLASFDSFFPLGVPCSTRLWTPDPPQQWRSAPGARQPSRRPDETKRDLQEWGFLDDLQIMGIFR